MADDALTVAKEITLALLPKATAISEPEKYGKFAGEVFKLVLKQVVEGIDEANK